jgi:hypothetical protein
MLIAGNVELPDKCPEDCPFKDDIANYGQNAMCGRCPIFVCTTFGSEEDEMGPMCLVEPEEYRHDWATVWQQWFADGMKGMPHLVLKMKE